jgi:eukaryotic-like serine/threonine-protein kinase
MNIPKHTSYHRPFALMMVLMTLILFLEACGSTSSPGRSRTPTPERMITPIAGATPTTVPLPPTQTSCPAPGTARGAVVARLTLGSHASIVYAYNQGRGSTPHPIAAFLKRYDSSTGSTTVILTEPHTFIDQAQVSADGQWVVFATQVADRSALQLVRLDGQGLQTLYCAAPGEQIGALAWSPDQRLLAFQEGQSVSLLAVATGAYQQAVHSGADRYYSPRTWLDNTRLYLAVFAVGTETPPLNLALLDSTTATVRPVLASPALYGDFDRSSDGTHLFTSECQFAMPTMAGPSSILMQPAAGGPATAIYQTSSYAITALRVASPTTLLLVIHNSGVGSIDTSHNGLWKVNTDGTGLTRLTSEAADEATGFPFTRTPWSVVSRDGGSYAVQMYTYALSTPGTRTPLISSSLLVGSMSGGPPVAFATLSRSSGTLDTLDIAGWTTM